MGLVINSPVFDTKKLKVGAAIRVTGSTRAYDTPFRGRAVDCLISAATPIELQVVYIGDNVGYDDETCAKQWCTIRIADVVNGVISLSALTEVFEVEVKAE